MEVNIMMLIDKEKLLQDIDTALAAAGYEQEVPVRVAEAFKVRVNRQPEVALPSTRNPDPNDGASGYWFDKGWNAYRQEMMNQ